MTVPTIVLIGAPRGVLSYLLDMLGMNLCVYLVCS